MKKNKKKYIVIGAVVLLVLVIIFISTKNGGEAFESAPVAIADVIQDIDVTGKIAAEQKADLAFEKTGIVSSVLVKVGDKVVQGQVLGSLDTREARASYQSAKANVLSEQAKLEESQKGTRKEELFISTRTYSNSVQSFSNVIRDTFVKIDNALRGNTDSLFTYADSSNPTLQVSVTTNNRKKEIESLRLKITESIDKWNDSLNIENGSMLAKDTIALTKQFLTLLQTSIQDPTDAQREIILLMQQEIATINTTFIDTQSVYETARGEYALAQAGNTNESVRAQQAKYEQAVAQAMSEEAILQKMTIIAPFEGIVTTVEPTVGETIAANTVAFTVMTANQYKIEVYVPESNIAKVSIGNVSKAVLDAYGPDTFFDATVSNIDPAETMIEGIPTYKVTLSIAADPRIRSGMTADINIVTAEKFGVLSIPTRAIIEKDGKTFVRLVSGDLNERPRYKEVPVVLGLRGSNGNTELIKGVQPGFLVVTKVK